MESHVRSFPCKFKIVRFVVTALMGRLKALEVPPPGGGFTTVTEAEPGEAISAGVIWVVREVAETKVVESVFPFQAICEEALKFVPVTERVNATTLAATEVGESAVRVGAGLSMVKLEALEVPPPGAGLMTVMEAVPAEAISVAVIGVVSELAET
jgi:hypothetical protein